MKLRTKYPYTTRHATDGSIRYGEQFEGKSSLTRSSFSYEGSLNYNRLPTEIRQAKTLQSFKIKLKQWIRVNIPLD